MRDPDTTPTPVSELKPGDMVDLEGDPFADKSKHPEFEFEFQTVETVDPETADCTAIYFIGGACIGFPPSHLVPVANRVVGESDQYPVMEFQIGVTHNEAGDPIEPEQEG